MLLHLDEVLLLALGLPVLPGEHRPLRIDHLLGRPHHVDDRVAVLPRQAREECRDHLHRLPFGLLDQPRVLGEFFDRLPLPIAFGVVFVGRTLGVGERLDPAGPQHLHQERRARPRQPRHDQQLLRFDRVIFGLLPVDLRLPDPILLGANGGPGGGLLTCGGLRGRLLFPQVVQRCEALRLAHRSLIRLPEPAIDPREQPLRPEKRGRKPARILQRPHRLLEPPLAGKRRPQQKMPLGIAELQADALGGRLLRLLGPAGAE